MRLQRLRESLIDFPRLSISGTRRAAVAMVIVNEGDRCSLIMTERTASLTDHPRQYALPGGRSEPGEDAEQTALRETEEEIGINPSALTPLGALDDYRTARGTVITPIVFVASAPLTFTPSPDEVHRVMQLDMSGEAPRRIEIPASDQPFGHPDAAPAQAIVVAGVELYAPTGALVRQLLQLWADGQIERVGDFREAAFSRGGPPPSAPATIERH